MSTVLNAAAVVVCLSLAAVMYTEGDHIRAVVLCFFAGGNAAIFLRLVGVL